MDIGVIVSLVSLAIAGVAFAVQTIYRSKQNEKRLTTMEVKLEAIEDDIAEVKATHNKCAEHDKAIAVLDIENKNVEQTTQEIKRDVKNLFKATTEVRDTVSIVRAQSEANNVLMNQLSEQLKRILNGKASS